MRSLQMAGLLLWRGGILFAGGAVVFEVGRRAVRSADVPPELEIGGGLLVGGALLVIGSIVAERISDRAQEGDLSE